MKLNSVVIEIYSKPKWHMPAQVTYIHDKFNFDHQLKIHIFYQIMDDIYKAILDNYSFDQFSEQI